MGDDQVQTDRREDPPAGLRGAAQRLIDAGYFVFPCKRRDKTPLTEHGCHDATTSTRQVEAWWRRWPGANIGIACGSSGLLVVDLDGNAALSVYAALEEVHGGTPTLTSVTGSGWHLIYADESGQGRNTAGLIGPGIDTRGPGGYIIAPPSVHPSGRRYAWMDDLRQPAPVPDWVLARLRPPAPPKLRGLEGGSRVLGHARLEGAARRVGETPVGNRHAALFWCAALAGELVADGVVSEDHARWLLSRAAEKNGLASEDPADVLRTISDGLTRGAGGAA